MAYLLVFKFEVYWVFLGGKPVCCVWKLPFFGFGFLLKLVGVGFLPDLLWLLLELGLLFSDLSRLTESPPAELFFFLADW